MRNCIIITLLALISCQAFAQQANEVRTCRILVLSKPKSVPDTLHLFDGLKSQEVELPYMNLSKVYNIAPGPVTLRMLSSPVIDPKSIPSAAPSVVVPVSTKHIYLLLTVDLSNKVAPVKMAIIDANYDKIGKGEMLWFNLTKNTVAGKIGSRNLNVKPGGRALVKEPARGSEDYPVELYFRVPGDDFIHPLCENRWRHNPSSRSISFIVADGNRRAPKIRTFSDFRLEPKTPTP